MSTTESLLDMVTEAERRALDMGALARKLITDHADLPVRTVALKYGGEVHLNVPDAGTVAAWAARLGASVRELTEASTFGTVYEHHNADTTIDGIRVHIWTCRILPDAEAATWLELREVAA